MSAFDYLPLGRVVFGTGALDRLGLLAREIGGPRALLVSDPGLVQVGYPQRARAVLQNAGYEVRIFDGVEENPASRHVEHGTAVAREFRPDLLVAVGGGSSMDVAKGINFLLTNGGAMPDYKGYGKATRPMLPSIGVPTTAGTGSEAQSYALIADDSSHLKMACGDRKAAFKLAILDPELTLTQPRLVAAFSGIDAIAHALESYVSIKATPLSRMFARQAWHQLHAHLERVLRQPNDLEARAAVLFGAHLAGMSIENSMLGCAHSCANPLTAHYGITHGIAVGLMLPHVIRFNAPAVDRLYAELAHDAHLEPHAGALADYVAGLLRACDLPASLTACGISRGILPLLAEEAHAQWTARFNPRPVTEADLLALYEAAL